MNDAPAPGFADTVHDAQRAFRAALDALARPGQPREIGGGPAGLPLPPAMAAVLLAMTDEDTPVWWQSGDAGLARWLRFHTGARSTTDASTAVFAVLTDASRMPPLDAFAAGSANSPEQSATLLVEVPTLDAEAGPIGRGPGIRDSVDLRIGGLPPGFWAQWQANHAQFPLGVDLLFTCGPRVLGLPRTVRVAMPEGA